MPNNGNKPRTIDAAEGSIVVKAPVAAVYQRWLVFEDYPRFVTAIKRVRKLDASHFVASLGFSGKQYDTTLEMMLCVPERRLAWRTLADHRAPDHFAAGVSVLCESGHLEGLSVSRILQTDISEIQVQHLRQHVEHSTDNLGGCPPLQMAGSA
jgi:hypothetical protein